MQVFGGFLLWFREKRFFLSNGGSNEIIEEYVEIMQKLIENPPDGFSEEKHQGIGVLLYQSFTL